MEFGLVGDSYTVRSASIADEECINLYVETRDGQKSLIYTPGLDFFVTFPATAPATLRGQIETGGRVFVVAGELFQELTSAGRRFPQSSSLLNDGLPVSMASNGQQILIVGAGRAYCYTIATRTLLDVTAQLAAIPMQVKYCDSYFVVAFKNSNIFQMSGILDGTTWPGIQVNAVSVFPENIRSIEVNHRELWVFGSRHAQPYQNTGSVEVFDVIPGSFIETGSAATFGTCLADNSVFWISDDERGGRMAWRSNGYTPARISTHAVEIDLASYPTLSGMTSYAYQDGGHLFWVLYIPRSYFSWVYDVGEGMWHKRASWVNGQWGPHLSWNHVYAFGLHLVGDWNSGRIYAMSQNAFTDNGSPIRRLRRAPILGKEMQYIRHRQLIIDADMGNLSTVTPTDKPAFAASLLGPSPGTAAVNTPIGGTAWTDPGNVLLNTGVYANVQLTAVPDSSSSNTSTGTSSGGGVAWTTPENIDSAIAFATVSLAAGGPPIEAIYTGKVSNSATPSNQRPADTSQILSGLPSTVATDATIYVVLSGSVVASNGGGVLSLYLSKDSGASWTLEGQNNATFPSVTVGITLTGLTNLNTVQLKLVASASCAPSGFSNVSLTVTRWYATLAGSSQPTAQTLAAAVTGLTIPAGMTIQGVGLSVNAQYTGDAPTFTVGLNVGSTQSPITLTTTPALYTAGGGSSLWGYDAWTAATLASLVVNFSASSTGSTVVYANKLLVTVYFTKTVIPSDAIDITAFGFAPADTALPLGIPVAVIAYASATGAQITAQPLKAGFPTGNPQTLPLSTTPTVIRFGGTNDIFGASFQDADLRDTAFGMRLSASTTSGTSIQVFIGYVTLQLYCPDTVFAPIYTGPDPALVDGDGNPRPPQIMVRWSDDRGKTWSNQRILDCGNLGEYKVRARLSRLGRSRYRVYEVSMSDAVPWVLVSGYLEAGQ